MAGNRVTLAFASKTISNTVQIYPEATITQPIYSLTGESLGAKRNDVMTVTTTLAGQTVARAFRAAPEADHEQHVPLVVLEQGSWATLLNGGYTRTLTIEGNLLWAGGPAGLLQLDLTTHLSQTHTLPGPTQGVVSV
ncbi:MAG: hypothetical protein HC787_09520, partial [Nostocaceae cyanobacterium CSU_2_110]|nr:hypothetical protein [Nostocaceae cyanobacterium CSU_2_110]